MAEKETNVVDKKEKYFIHIVEYANRLFTLLRQIDGVNMMNILDSFNLVNNASQIARAKESIGKSGSFFFFTYDNQFILKTLNDAELKNMRNVVYSYFNHIIFSNQSSILSRVYGLYTIHIEGLAPIHLMLMENSRRLLDPDLIKNVYDIKGYEAKGRKAKVKRKRRFQKKKSNVAQLSTTNTKKLKANL